jgi:hypothetical protein
MPRRARGLTLSEHIKIPSSCTDFGWVVFVQPVRAIIRFAVKFAKRYVIKREPRRTM